MPRTIEIRRDGLTLELLLHQAHGLEGRALLAEALAMNPGIAAAGPVLRLGTRVIIPDRPEPNAFSPRPVVSLFGG